MSTDVILLGDCFKENKMDLKGQIVDKKTDKNTGYCKIKGRLTKDEIFIDLEYINQLLFAIPGSIIPTVKEKNQNGIESVHSLHCT